MRYLVLAAILAAYSPTCFFYFRWLARKRVEALTFPSRFGPKQRVVAFCGSLLLAMAVPAGEAAIRVMLNVGALDDGPFIAFLGAWIIAMLPGIVSGRKILRAGGINPDE